MYNAEVGCFFYRKFPPIPQSLIFQGFAPLLRSYYTTQNTT
nr:MAG TPA: hypothetical protein [Caudoviricetes sp.]